MKNKKLNPEDQEMLEAFEAGKFQSDLKDERRTQLANVGYVVSESCSPHRATSHRPNPGVGGTVAPGAAGKGPAGTARRLPDCCGNDRC